MTERCNASAKGAITGNKRVYCVNAIGGHYSAHNDWTGDILWTDKYSGATPHEPEKK